MAPLPRPHGTPQDLDGTAELYGIHLRTTLTMTKTSTEHTLGPRGLGPHIGSVSALYIFVGILISLCIAAPGIGRLRNSQGKKTAEYLRRVNKAVVKANETVAELASLQERQDRLVQEKDQQEESLRDERLRCQTLQEQISVLKQSLRDEEEARGQLREEKNTAVTEAEEARRLHSTAAEAIQTLGNQLRAKEERIRSLQQRYNYVDQECRQLMNELVGNKYGGT
jgi:vacuolar-type H+-ATPase subunit I/STV1